MKFVFYPPLRRITRQWAQQLATRFPQIAVVAPETAEEAAAALPDADAAFGTLPPSVFAHAGRLRWLQAPAAAPPAGYYHAQLVAHPVLVTNFREIYNDHIANHILACVLAFARGLHQYIPLQLQHRWQPRALDTGIVHLAASTALIVGVGGIGAETARLLAAFGVRVLGVDARRHDAPPGMHQLAAAEHIDTLLGSADFVIVTVPHTPQTEGMFGPERFARMKPGAFFINIGRGMTTRLDAVDAALRSGRLAGAALDVYEIEPLPLEHPLWTAPNAILTPHIAGFGPHLDDRRFEVIADNVQRLLDGKPLRNVVDKANWF